MSKVLSGKRARLVSAEERVKLLQGTFESAQIQTAHYARRPNFPREGS